MIILQYMEKKFGVSEQTFTEANQFIICATCKITFHDLRI